MGALIRFYYKIDPDELDDDTFAKRWAELTYALDFDQKARPGQIN